MRPRSTRIWVDRRCAHRTRDRLSRRSGTLCPVTTTFQLRQLAIEPSGTDDRFDLDAAPTRLSGVLVIRSKGSVQMIAASDVIELLVALLSDLPYRAHGQEIRARKAADGQAEVLLVAAGTRSVAARLPYEAFFRQLVGLVTTAATELSRLGVARLADPLVAVLRNEDRPQVL